ncbi:MAG: bifunctional 2',3'-cyclic-nucleotide 2'-phosphodiesterase/3'-nucleotidase [Alphaproteobacteria bacterium]|nr:bifunctional 2',3'-cyclic-nucleotide 2'-phosphodiesterase/3'-nucleotidase [Alphaproteobacteria bacterium]
MRFSRLVALVLALALPVAAQAAELRLRILATTDLHMNLVDYDFIRDQADETIGLDRTAALIEEARTQNPNAILVDAGDLLQGSPMGDVVARDLAEGDEIHPAYAIMNALHYDAAATGNHEFNFGLDFLERAQKGRDFPLLAANVYRAHPDGSRGETLFPAATLLTRRFKDSTGAERDVKIGVIGALPPQIMTWDRDKLSGRLVTGDAVEAVAREIPGLRAQGADVIVVIAHSGLSAAPQAGGDENFAAYLAPVDGVDAIVSGHSHRIFPGKDYDGFPGANLAEGTIDGKPVVMAGAYGSHLGVIDLTLDDAGGHWAVTDGRGEARPVAPRGEGKPKARLPADPAVDALASPWRAATLAYVRAPIGEAKAPINTYLTLLGDTGALRLVADAQLAAAQEMVKGTPYEGLPILSAAAPFRVGGRPGPDYYTDIKAGPIAIKDAADLYVYPNILTIVKLKGAEVREYLEKAARLFNRIDPAKTGAQPLVGDMPAYGFDVLFGLTYQIDVTQPARYGRGPTIDDPNAHRVSDIRYSGEALKDDQDYLIVTNNYRANGGGEFPRMDGSAVVLVGEEPNRDVLIAYIRARREITPDPTPVWRFAPVGGAPDVRIAIGPGGAAAAASDPRLSKVETNAAGFDVYRVQLPQS